eukprot:TRINITY_DN2126_c0_g1_i12.p1 TRINITY_DN2126_c0_g1~~TRINITY_DN2126_c0_g1_i12.p1  ORF type:complete len:496 (-),score=15.61 TRINITY_DN2126_c0_g1_i12:179-1666(-)
MSKQQHVHCSQMSSFNDVEGGVDSQQAEYVVLDHIELIEARSLIVQHTCDTLNISEDMGVRILRRFGWEIERATEIWQSDEEQCRSLLGVPRGCDDTIIQERDGICFMCEVRQRVVYHASCGHFACRSCLNKYVSSRVEGSSAGHFCLDLRCMHPECDLALQRVLLEEVCNPEVFEKLTEHDSQSFVDDNPCIVRCPANRCDNVIWCQGVTLNSEKGLNVTCTCGLSFCFHCRREAHAPLKCKTVRELQHWVELKGVSSKKLLERMKPCPNCRKLASRKGRENDIWCRQCGYHFCWMCLGMWDNQYQDLENSTEFYHHCRFFPRPGTSQSEVRNSARKDTTASNMQKQRCLYMEQYEKHVKGIQLALLKIVQFRIKLVGNEQVNEQILDKWKFLLDCWHQAVSTHILLKWTYLVASWDPFSDLISPFFTTKTSTNKSKTLVPNNVRTWKRRQRSWQGWCQAPQKSSTRQYPRYYQARYQKVGTKRWRQTNQRDDI